MRVFMIGVLLGYASAGGASAQSLPKKEAPGKGERSTPLGAWEVLHVELPGQPLSTGAKGLIWDIRSDGTIQLVYHQIPGWKMLYKHSIDTSKVPHEIDIIFTGGRHRNKLQKIIFKIENDILTVCCPNDARANIESVARPTAFDLATRPDLRIFRFKRSAWGAKPDSADGPAIVFTALSDEFNINGSAAAGKKDPADLAPLIRSDNRELAALAKDAQTLIEMRRRSRVATAVWQRGAARPAETIRQDVITSMLKELEQPDTPDNCRNFADDLLTMLQLSDLNTARVRAAGELLLQLEKVQSKTLLPVLRARFPKAAPEGGSVSMSVTLERKLPAEMTLINNGPKPLHNVVVWFEIEMNPQPALSAEEMKGVFGAYLLGAHRTITTKWNDKKLQDWATGLGSRNLVFIRELKPKDAAKITYELGSIRRSKRAEFSLYCDELRVTSQEITGVREMQEAIEKMFGGK